MVDKLMACDFKMTGSCRCGGKKTNKYTSVSYPGVKVEIYPSLGTWKVIRHGVTHTGNVFTFNDQFDKILNGEIVL